METQWKGHTLELRGDWTARWLFLTPTYELWLDDTCVDRVSGPRVQPHLEAIYEDEDGEIYHIEADLLSLVGLRPSAEISVEGDLLEEGHVSVENVLNPFLILLIISSTAIMLYVGPDVLRQFVDQYF